MTRRLVLLSVSLTLVLGALAGLTARQPAGLAHAQDRSVVGKRFDVDLTVHKDGNIDVVETLTIAFQGGPFSFGFRTVPLDRIERITDVRVFEGDRERGERRFEQSSGEAPETFQTRIEGGDLNIRWYFSQTSDSTHTYVLKYIAQGAVRIYEGGDQVWWTAIGADHNYPIQASRVTVRLPEGVDEIHKWESYGVAAKAEVADPRTIVFTAQDTIRPGQRFEVRAQFPHGVVEAPPPAWQEGFDAQVAEQEGETLPEGVVAEDPFQTAVNLLAGFIGLFIAVAGIVGLFILWYTRGRDAPVPLVAEYLPEPPSDLPPGTAGTLLDETADMQDIIATLIDLARRGVITMKEIEEKGFLGIGARHDFVFEKRDHAEILRTYEKTLLRELFGGRQTVKLSSLKEKFYTAVPELQDQLYDEVVDQGFFQRSPESTRRIYTLLGFVGIVVSFIIGVFALPAVGSFAPAVLCIPLGLMVVSVGAMIFGRVMPRKTTKGSEAAARWQAFKRYLENIEDYTDLEEAKGIFDKYLPYAVAFGLENSWVQKFAEVDAPAPPWYQPAGPVWGRPWLYGPGHRPHPRGGGPIFTGPGSGGSAPSAGSGRSGGSRPDLQRTSDSLGRGLQSMSDGLATMLNTAGNILASAPKSSGGGGGWSGGGGGFSGGGGGSGGGGSGFG